jgi:hypothetical protein
LGKSSGTESDDPYSVYRNDKQGDKWRSELPQEIINEVLDDTDFRKIAKHYEFGK